MLASATLCVLIASAPTPLGVAITSGGKAKAYEGRLTDAIVSSLQSDRRFTPVLFPEEPSTPVDKVGALAALTAGRDAFMLLEGAQAQAKLREGTRALLLAFFQRGPREGRDDELKELLDAWAQRVGVLSQLGEKKAAKKVAATLAALDRTYVPADVEFLGEDAAKVIASAQKRARRRGKKGKLQVKAPKTGVRALVRVDGEERGAAPLKLKVAPGLHVVEVHAPGAISVIKLVEVKARRTAKVKAELELSRAAADAKHDLSTLDLTRPGYQRVMGQIGSRYDAPEVLLVTFREVGSALQLRARRVDVKAQIIRGSSKTVVKKSASDLDEALLFALEEVLLGERLEGGTSAEGTAGAVAATSAATTDATPADAQSDEADTGAPAAATAEAPGTKAPPEKVADASTAAPETPAAVERVTGAPAAADEPASEAEEGSGAALYLGAAGAAGGVGALLVVGVGAAVLTAVALQGSQPAVDDTGRAQRTGTTWTATGLVY